jgi:hypothetical protein
MRRAQALNLTGARMAIFSLACRQQAHYLNPSAFESRATGIKPVP